MRCRDPIHSSPPQALRAVPALEVVVPAWSTWMYMIFYPPRYFPGFHHFSIFLAGDWSYRELFIDLIVRSTTLHLIWNGCEMTRTKNFGRPGHPCEQFGGPKPLNIKLLSTVSEYMCDWIVSVNRSCMTLTLGLSRHESHKPSGKMSHWEFLVVDKNHHNGNSAFEINNHPGATGAGIHTRLARRQTAWSF